MKFFRLYAGTDGQSHFESLDTGERSEFLNKTVPAIGFLIRTAFAPHIVNFHRAPRRRWVITLAGSVDIGLGDGTLHRYGACHVTLAEDLTGKGHTTRVVGDKPRLSATIPLGD